MLQIIISLIVVGVLLWAVNSFIPMDAKIKSLLNVIVIVVVLLWLLSVFGLIGKLPPPFR
jgi:type IV secretory pathway TrbD component